jgi:outer membrane lipoprotein-sorting protein
MRMITAILLVALGGIAAAEEPAKPPETTTGAKKPTAQEILAKCDHALNAFKDAIWESKLRVKEPNGTWRELTFTTYQKVPGKRLVRFTGGENKGMNVLIESADTIYVYLPEFKRVRRMGTHVKNQTFGGSDFSSEDMSQISYGVSFDPTLASEDDKSYILELKAKGGQEREFPRIKMWVSKEHWGPTRLEFMDAAGKKLKTEELIDFKKDSPEHWQPSRVRLIDHRRNDHTSEIEFLSSKIDTGLSDDLFTVRALQR